MQLRQEETTQNSPAGEAAGTQPPPGFKYVDRKIPLDLIDPPENPERETFDPEALEDLIISIDQVGLIMPLTVFAKGGRFEVMAGHRRLIACQALGFSPVNCCELVGEGVDPVAVMVAENADREPVNPVQQARFYRRLYEGRCNQDVDALCALVQRKRGHVEDRLVMLKTHPLIVDAIEQKKISMAVGARLARVKDERRLVVLLDAAINSGATARMVDEWCKNADQLGPIGGAAPDAGDVGAIPPAATPVDGMVCVFCGGANHKHMMRMLWVHAICEDMMNNFLPDPMARNRKAEG